ncbi:MAG TPA: GNAT family N-acetyltransferase [Aggregatilineales bacterium]|nr:GNAT family N-acetyltransferase [Aggregatilineales bacterium]
MVTSFSPLEVVRADICDSDTVVGILTDAARWLMARDLPTWKPETLPRVILPAIERGEVYLATCGGRPVATVSLQWVDLLFWGERPDDAGYLHKLAVLRSAAGQRIGERLVRWVEDAVIERSRRYVRLDCHAGNPAINQFYQNLGYRARGRVAINGTEFTLYEKSVSR